jgi:DNA-binding transcriptional ArsR family regulator
MGKEADLRREIQELREQVARLERTLDRVAAPYSELLAYVERFQELSRAYFRILALYERYGEVAPDLVIPGLKDPIAREIVKTLFERGGRNISQITEALRVRRGTASRRIVRQRLEDLERQGVVAVAATSRGRAYRISDDVVRMWSRVLGLAKYEGHPEENPEGKGGDGNGG